MISSPGQSLRACAEGIAERAATIGALLEHAGIELVHRVYFDTLIARVPGRAESVIANARERGIHLRLVDADHVGVSVGETCDDRLVAEVLRSFDASLEEAALMSGASGRRVFTRVSLPLATPAFLALLLLVCIRAFEAFDIPALVGSAGGVAVLSTDVFESIRKDLPPSYGQDGAFSIVLVIVVALLARLSLWCAICAGRGSSRRR